MKKKILSAIIVLISTVGLMAQPGQQAVTLLLKDYQANANISKGQSFSNSNDQKFTKLFTSNNALVSALGLGNNENKKVSLSKFVSLMKDNFDEESDIVVVLSKIKFHNPDKLSSNKYIYKVSASQSLTAFKADGSDFTSLETVTFEIEYIVSANVAKITSIETVASKSGMYIDVHVNGSSTSIKGDLATDITGELTSKSKFNFGFGISLDYMISEKIGITSGFSMMGYSSTYELTNFDQAAFRTIDQDGDEYDLLANGNNIVNDVKLNYIEIPIGIVIRLGEFISRIGVKYGIPGSSSSSFTDGNLSTSGYYQKYNVTLYDIPEYGFDDYELAGSEGSIEHKSSLSGFIQLGYNASISKKASISITGFYQTSLSSVHDSSGGNLASGNETYTSVINLMDSPKTSAFGVEIGLGIKLF